MAHAITGTDRPYDEVPYFWSDQAGLRLQHVGHAEEPATVDLTQAIGPLRRALAEEATAAAA